MTGSYTPHPTVAPAGGALRLRLYIAGAAPISELARANLDALLASCGAADCELEVIDCIREPRRALAEGVFVTPTLIKAAPGPAQTIVGALSDARRVLAALGLAAPAAEQPAHA
jgi:circadian clock protein KaiB